MTRTPAPLRDAPYGRRPLVVVLLLVATQVVDNAMFGVALPDISRELELELGDLLDIVAFLTLVVGVAGIGAAWLMDRWRRLPFLLVGQALSGVFTALTGRARSYGGLGGVLTTDSAVESAARIPLVSLLADWYPLQMRGRVFSALSAASTVASVVSLVVAGVLIQRFGYRTAFAFVGIVVFGSALVASVILREPPPGGVEGRAVRRQPPTITESFRLVFTVPTTRRLVISVAVIEVGTVIVALGLPFLLSDHYGLDALGRGLVLTPQAFGAVLGALVVGRWVDRTHVRAPDRVILVFAFGVLVFGLGLLAYVARPPLPVLAATLFPIGFVAALVGPAFNTVLTALVPASGRTVGLQLMFLPTIPALVFGPVFAGTLFDEFGLDGLFLGAIPFFVLAAAIQLAAAPGYARDLRRIAAAGAVRAAFEQDEPPVLVARVGDDELRVGPAEVVVVQPERDLVAALESDDAPPGTVVQLHGRDVYSLPRGERQAAGLAVVGPDALVPPDVSVADTVRLTARREDDVHAAVEVVPEVLDFDEACGADLDRRRHWLAGVARAVASGAEVVVLDPPATVDVDAASIGRAIRDHGRVVVVVDRPRHRSAPEGATGAGGEVGVGAAAPGLTVVVDGDERLLPTSHDGTAVVVGEPVASEATLTDLLQAIDGPPDEAVLEAVESMQLPADVPLADLDAAQRRLAALVAVVARRPDEVLALDPTAVAAPSRTSAVVSDLWQLKRAVDVPIVLVAPGPSAALHLADRRVVR